MTNKIEYYDPIIKAWKDYSFWTRDGRLHEYEDRDEAVLALYEASRHDTNFIFSIDSGSIPFYPYIWENEQMITAEHALEVIELLLVGETIKGLDLLKSTFLDIEIDRFTSIKETIDA